MTELSAEQITLIQTRIQSGLREHASTGGRQRSVQFADGLAEIYREMESDGAIDVDAIETVGDDLGQIDTTTLRRLRKITELVEDEFRIGVGHRKLSRAAVTGSKLTSIGAFLVAGHNLLISAERLDSAHARAASVQEIKDRRFHDFYRAICVFIAHGFLLTTPINFKFAWRGTRYVNKRVLYRFRSIAPNIHRLILSEIHYVIRDIAPRALRAPEEFTVFLTSMAVQTIELLREFSDIDLTNLPQLVRDVIDEYRSFVDEMYAVVTAEIDVNDVVRTTTGHLTGVLNFESVPAGPTIRPSH